MAQNQTAVADPVVKMDSRKFLGALNTSAQAKVTSFESRIKKMGRKAGKNWQLVALRDADLFFEDVDTNQYYLAEYSGDSKVTISNIRPVDIFEKEKQQVFEDTCMKLVNAIEENDQRGMAAMFNTMKKHRFSGRSVPFSGMVQCRDGVRRHIKVQTQNILDESVRPRLIAAIVEGLQDQVIVENGQVTSATFNDGSPVKLPVTKWAARKLVAKRMREAATSAYMSEGFQNRIHAIAGMISEGNIEEAVKFISPFLDEMEEFTLLTRAQAQTLVENAMATHAIFNQALCNDTATLFHRTNMRVNKNKIVAEWRNIAKKAEHPVLAENVQILSESKNFEAAYNKFLELIFEAISNREVAAEALATTLEVLRTKTPRIKESHELASKLDNLIVRLKDPKFDDAAIYEAEDLIATIQEELAANETLANFDQIPGQPEKSLAEQLGELGAVDAGGGESGAPVININAPLVQVGGSSGGAEEEALGGEELGAEEELGGLGGEEEELGGLGGEEEELGGLGGEEAGGELADLLGGGGLGEGKRRRKALRESRPIHAEMKPEGDDDMPDFDDDEDLDESLDPYALNAGVRLAENMALSEYGSPVITDDKDMRRIVAIMNKLAEEHGLEGKKLEESLESMARAGIKAIGLRIPNGKIGRALEQVVESYIEESDKPFPGAAPPFGSDDDEGGDDGGDDEDEDDFVEDQFKGPRIRGRGFKKTAYKPRELKNESALKWGEAQDDAVAGSINGVGFIFDHGGINEELKPVILSEDGALEIPVPEQLYHDAFAAAGLTKDGNPDRFAAWLSESIEQLRPVSDAEDRALKEAMAKITTTPDGQIQVEVTDDVGVGEVGDEGMEGMEGMEGLEGEEGLEGGEEEMAPVDSMEVEEPGAEEAGLPGEEMPDFEGAGELGGEAGAEMGAEPAAAPVDPNAAPQPAAAPAQPAQPAAPAPEEEQFEDKDVTSPQSSKYTKHVKDNKRDMPAHKMTGKTDDKLDSIGPDLKVDDGSGTKPPTAKSQSDK